MTKLYDPKLYTLVIAGIPLPAKGYADGEFIKLARDAQAFTDVAGTDGDVTRVRQHDRRATVTFTTMQHADVNAILSTLHASDLNSESGAGIGPFLLKDRNGLTVHASDECWIAQMPEVTLDKGATGRAWMIRIASLNSFEGG